MKFLMIAAALFMFTQAQAGTVNDITLKNQFGEQSINQIIRNGTNPMLTLKDSSATFAPELLMEKNENTTATDSSLIVLRRSRGTAAAPTHANSGDLLGAIIMRGYGTSAYQTSGARIYAFATETFSNSANGTSLALYSTPNTTITPKQRVLIDQDGGVEYVGATSGFVKLIPAATVTSYTLTLPSAQGTGCLQNDGSGGLTWVPKSNSIVVITCGASAGGAATEALTCTGLAASDTIVSVFQRVKGANSTALNGYSGLGTNALTASWTGDPGANAIVMVSVIH